MEKKEPQRDETREIIKKTLTIHDFSSHFCSLFDRPWFFRGADCGWKFVPLVCFFPLFFHLLLRHFRLCFYLLHIWLYFSLNIMFFFSFYRSDATKFIFLFFVIKYNGFFLNIFFFYFILVFCFFFYFRSCLLHRPNSLLCTFFNSLTLLRNHDIVHTCSNCFSVPISITSQNNIKKKRNCWRKPSRSAWKTEWNEQKKNNGKMPWQDRRLVWTVSEICVLCKYQMWQVMCFICK